MKISPSYVQLFSHFTIQTHDAKSAMKPIIAQWEVIVYQRHVCFNCPRSTAAAEYTHRNFISAKMKLYGLVALFSCLVLSIHAVSINSLSFYYGFVITPVTLGDKVDPIEAASAAQVAEPTNVQVRQSIEMDIQSNSNDPEEDNIAIEPALEEVSERLKRVRHKSFCVVFPFIG